MHNKTNTNLINVDRIIQIFCFESREISIFYAKSQLSPIDESLYFITKMSHSSVSHENKKKKYKKKQPSDSAISKVHSLSESYKSESPNFGDISSIHHLSDVSRSRISSTLKKAIFQPSIAEKTIIETQNLHHENIYIDLKNEFEDRDLIKQLKKYIKKAFPNAKSIEIFAGRRSPTLKFQYLDASRDNQLKIRSLADLLKANKELGTQQQDTIQKIFDHLYCRVNEKDKKIVIFLDQLAQKKRIDLSLVNSKRKIPLLYYEYDDKNINFTLFDLEMKIFSFDLHTVQECKLEDDSKKIWTQFVGAIEKKRLKNQKQFDQFGDFQASSDEESHVRKIYNIQEIQQKLKKLLITDLTDFEEDLEEINSKCDNLQSKNDDRDRPELQRLADQVFELHHNIDNFKEVKSFVEEEIKRKKDPNRLHNCLKMLIIAEKQLKSKLPIVGRKTQIFKLLNSQDLIILEGETGSGKSTQLPQMLCEYYKMFDDHQEKVLPVLITQPRRLATRTVAERVAYEMEESIGGFVDYATSSHKAISKSAKIVFKLDSVVLDELTQDRQLSKYSCLIIDEAHERTISIDVILGLVKKLLETRKGFKVIITSASLDGKLFSDYFHKKVFKVSGRLYPVDIIYHPLSHESDIVKKVETVLKKQILLNKSEMRDQYKGDVLVFCSGVDDINNLCFIFQKYLSPRVFKVFALHGKIAISEQRQVFYETKEHKIIFASRIAETSITINGIKVVIDPGVDRELVYDQKYRVSSRKLVNISQSSAKQRAGRAGRTSSGYCFRLYSENQLSKFRVNKTPQIDNMALDTLVLRLKSLKVDIFNFQYIKKPDVQALKQSIETLQMIGGISEKEQFTTVGKLLLQLHVEPFLGRSIVEAIICEYLVKQTNFLQNQACFKKWEKRELVWLKDIKSYVIEILCMVINSSNLFSGNPKLYDRIDQIKYTKFSNQKGDFFYLSNIYSEFYHKMKDKGALDYWIKSHYLNKKTLFQTKELVDEIREIIKNFKLDVKDKSIRYLIDTIKLKLLYCQNIDDAILSCMITSFCVNLCIYSENPRVGYTLVLQKKPVIIYGTSTLAQQGLNPKWILCYDLKTNDKGSTYCTIAHEVNFDFLKNTVENYVFNRLNLRQTEKMNPFYDHISRQLPTSVFIEIQQQYLNKDNHNIEILRHITLDFSEENNTLDIFYSKDLKLSEILGLDWKLEVKHLVFDYIEQKILAKKNEKFICNVVSNIFAEFEDGFLVKAIRFADIEIEFVVKGQKFLLNTIRNELDGVNAYTFGDILKIIVYNEFDQNRITVLLNQYKDSQVVYDIQRRQKKQETLLGKIYMRFYSDKLKKQPLFLYYGKKAEDKSKKMENILSEFQIKEKKKPKITTSKDAIKFIETILTCRFQVSYKGNGIKCYNNYIDAYELKEAFDNLIITGVLPFDFEKPYSIREFREESAALDLWTEKQWEESIKTVFKKYKFQGLNVSVSKQKREEEDPDYRTTQKIMNKELTAVITSKSIQTIDDMVRTLDGKENIIGEGKIHFRYNFKQHIAKINRRTMKVLQEDFQQLRRIHETTSNVKIEHYEKTFGKVTYVFVSCRSSIRENLLLPSEEIKDLFMPFIKRLSVSQFNFLNNTQQGEKQMDKIQEDIGYRVCFGFIKKNNCLKIYCHEDQIDDVEGRIQQIFQKHQVYVEDISYRGKGLARIEEILTKIIYENQKILRNDKKSKLVLFYNIIFKRRAVQIYGDVDSIKKAKYEIQKINNIAPGSCSLCCKNVQKPFKLTRCQHEFCEKCLSDYIDQTKKEENLSSTTPSTTAGENSSPLVCPFDNCQAEINSFDIQTILSTQQFESLSMRRLKEYVKTHPEFFFCSTPNCEQIFELKKVESGQSFECMMCGRWFCSKCKQPHQHFSCQEWQTKLVKGQLARLGFKKCRCGYVIQKQNKGKTVRCRNCKEYLCWSCGNIYKTEKNCLEHVKICKK